MNILSIRTVDITEGRETGRPFVTVRIGFMPHEVVIQRAKFRNWIEETIATGQILEVYEDRNYMNLKDGPHRGGRMVKTLSYFFHSDSEAVAFRLAFNDDVYNEPDPSIYRRTR